MNKVLIHSIVFNPDGVSTAYLYNDIALKLKESGYKVVVYTTTPHYNYKKNNKDNFRKKYFGLYSKSNFNGIPIFHIFQKKYKSTWKRLLGFIYWHFMTFLLILFERDVKVILSPSPPLSIGFLNIILGKIKGAKVIYNVQEIYPDLLISNKGLESSFIIKFLKRLEKFVYNYSNRVITIDKVFYNFIEPRFEEKNKLLIIPNFVDTDLYRPMSLNKNDYSRLVDKGFPYTKDIKVMYAGNIGLAQEWDTLISLVDKLRYEKFSFFVIGNGIHKEKIEEAKNRLKLEKLYILPYQNRKEIPTILSYSDIQFIFMNPELDEHGFPSKVYTIMACGKPMLIASGKNTPIVNFLEDKDCSFISSETVSLCRAEDFANFLRKTTKEELKLMGTKGVELVRSFYSKKVVTKQYVDLVKELID